MTTGQRIKAARKQAQMTQKELGEKLGISYQTVAQWENDLRNPKQETLLRISKVLGIHLRDLVDSSLAKEFDRRYPDMGEKVNRFSAVSKYLEEMGYGFDYRLLSGPNEENEDVEYILSKGDHTVIFSETEFEELQAGAKEAIEGRFYKKLVAQQNK